MNKEQFWATMQSQPEADPEPEPELELKPAQKAQSLSTAYTLELGYRTDEIGHPANPWPSFVQQNDEGRVLVDFNNWAAQAQLQVPKINFKTAPFPFPFGVDAVRSALEKQENQDEWRNLMLRSIYLPFFIYTPTIFLMLNAVDEGATAAERHWQAPVQLTSDIILCYHQVIHVLLNSNLQPPSTIADIMEKYESDLGRQVTTMVALVRSNAELKAMHESQQDSREGRLLFARYIASQTIGYIRLLEGAICRLSNVKDMEPNAAYMRPFLCEYALPDPAAFHISPHTELRRHDWRLANLDHINGIYNLHNKPPPLEDLGAEEDNTRGISNAALWFFFLHLMDTRESSE